MTWHSQDRVRTFQSHQHTGSESLLWREGGWGERHLKAELGGGLGAHAYSQLQDGASLEVHVLGFLWHRQSGHLAERLPLVRCYPGNEWVPSIFKLLTLYHIQIRCLFRVPMRGLSPLLRDSGNAVSPHSQAPFLSTLSILLTFFLVKGAFTDHSQLGGVPPALHKAANTFFNNNHICFTCPQARKLPFMGLMGRLAKSVTNRNKDKS